MKNSLKKGEITIGTVAGALGILSMVVAPIVSYYSAQAATQKDISTISERVKAVETFVPTIDKRLENIERGLKLVPYVAPGGIPGATITAE